MFRIISKLKNRKGFTLIELIVVLAVLAIIMAIAVPRFLGVQETAKEDADYATGASIAKAAELYVAQNEAAVLGTGGLPSTDHPLTTSEVNAVIATLNDIDFKSARFSGPDEIIGITVTSSGSIEVTVTPTSAGTTLDIYPRP